MSGNPPVPERFDSLQASTMPTNPEAFAVMAGDGVPSSDAPTEDSTSSEVSVFEYEASDFHKDMFNTLSNFMSDEVLTDVEIQCGKKSFKCHRLVLAGISGYFKTMFTSTMAESRQEVVKIQDIDENVLESIIKFAYSGKIGLTVENVQSVLYAASILQIENIAHACSSFMKEHLHPDNCVQVHAFAMQHNREQLIQHTHDFITENFSDVSKTPDFKTMSASVIESLIDSSNLNVSSEIEVFEAIIDWINFDKEIRKQHLAVLMKKMKLPLINTSYLMENVATNELVRSNLECRDFLDEAKYYQMYLGNLVADVKITDRTRPRKSYAGMSDVTFWLSPCLKSD